MSKKHNCALNTSTPDASTQTAHYQCPLARLLKKLSETQSFYLAFNEFMDLGVITFERGHYSITEIDTPCPFAQALETQQPESERHEPL